MIDESAETKYAALRELEKTHVCATCGANLVTVWNDERAVSRLVCAKDHAHKGVKLILSNTTLLKRGELDTQHRAGTQADMEKAITQGEGVTSLAPLKDVATGDKLTLIQVSALANFATSVGLKAPLGHVCLYYGNPYVTIDGYYYLKNKGALKFAVCCMPMDQDERFAYQVTEGSHAFIARAISLGGDELNRGIGIITPEEMSEKSKKNPEHFAAPIVHDKPQRMAEKRAEWQLLKKMIPLGAERLEAGMKAVEDLEKKAAAEEDAKHLWE
jgi:hypothetical protein